MKLLECEIKYKKELDLNKIQLCYSDVSRQHIVLYNPIYKDVIILQTHDEDKSIIGDRINYRLKDLQPLIGDLITFTYET